RVPTRKTARPWAAPGQWGRSSRRVGPPSLERAIIETKSLQPSFDWTTKVQPSPPARVTAQRGPAATAVGPAGSRLETKPSARVSNVEAVKSAALPSGRVHPRGVARHVRGFVASV